MTSAYWAQWDRAEIMSMHGVEEDNTCHDNDHDDSHNDRVEEGEEEHNCSGCMDCLGFSWRDFM